jgi:hypothetical protein
LARRTPVGRHVFRRRAICWNCSEVTEQHGDTDHGGHTAVMAIAGRQESAIVHLPACQAGTSWAPLDTTDWLRVDGSPLPVRCFAQMRVRTLGCRKGSQAF